MSPQEGYLWAEAKPACVVPQVLTAALLVWLRPLLYPIRLVMRKRTPHGCVILAVYDDDIIITGSDAAEVTATKAYLAQHFVTRDLSPPRVLSWT